MLTAFMLAGAESAAGHGEAKAAFPPFETWHMPSQLFWLAILFTTLYFAMSRYILPKLGDTIEKRSDRIASDLDEAARLDDQAKEAQKALELRLAQARANARATADAARARVDADLAEESKRTDQEIERKLSAADSRLAGLRADAMKNVESIAAEAAGLIASRLGVKASPSDLAQAVSSVLGKK
jgi:F-type H+-transporting ATPase subunit b